VAVVAVAAGTVIIPSGGGGGSSRYNDGRDSVTEGASCRNAPNGSGLATALVDALTKHKYYWIYRRVRRNI